MIRDRSCRTHFAAFRDIIGEVAFGTLYTQFGAHAARCFGLIVRCCCVFSTDAISVPRIDSSALMPQILVGFRYLVGVMLVHFVGVSVRAGAGVVRVSHR